MKVKRLKEKLQNAKNELYDLHFLSHSPEAYKLRRAELEWEIVCLEDEIHHQELMTPFKIVLGLFCIFAVAILIYSLLK